ncbi:Bug family tripartite tricarboxylate transporter substrate binding protein [Ottowia thiooxydans]|uniref:Bug family tripartite tricarboxylate transporter substrate binding protein n=1 Tax=Ottowia thiooxydans TaxID=219182 RepID=UPI000400126B|nr:tripartite tricarboxylate transporter substrate binding protein [Ottowia thiooxydans]
MRRSKFLRSALIASAICTTFGMAAPVLAQGSYPSKPIKFIVPYPPGASTDNMARAFAQELGKELKTTVVIENRPGGGTSIGALAVKGQPADGHTLFFHTGELAASKLANPGLAYVPSDFEVITPLAKTAFTLIVPTQFNIKTMDDLKAHAAKKQGELNFGTLGLGANQYSMLSRTLSQHLGVTATMIPYKGGMEGVTATMTGEIDAYYATVGLTRGQKDNNRIHVLATTGDGPNKFLPGVKSFKELGVKDMVYYSLYGVAVRADTPEPIKAVLKDVTRRVTDSDELKKVRQQISLEDFAGTTDDFKMESQKNFLMLKAAYDQETKK